MFPFNYPPRTNSSTSAPLVNNCLCLNTRDELLVSGPGPGYEDWPERHTGGVHPPAAITFHLVARGLGVVGCHKSDLGIPIWYDLYLLSVSVQFNGSCKYHQQQRRSNSFWWWSWWRWWSGETRFCSTSLTLSRNPIPRYLTAAGVQCKSPIN